MSIRDSVPNPDQGAVVEGDTAPTDAEVGMPPGPSQVPEDSEGQVREGQVHEGQVREGQARGEDARREEDAREESEVESETGTEVESGAGIAGRDAGTDVGIDPDTGMPNTAGGVA